MVLMHLYRNKSAAYKWICSDVPSACKQHKAAEFLQEIKELGYMSKSVHWRQNSCSRLFWTFTYHFPIPKHGVMAVVFHSCQRLHSLPNCYQSFGVKLWECACAVKLQLSEVNCSGLCRLKYLMLKAEFSTYEVKSLKLGSAPVPGKGSISICLAKMQSLLLFISRDNSSQLSNRSDTKKYHFVF